MSGDWNPEHNFRSNTQEIAHWADQEEVRETSNAPQHIYGGPPVHQSTYGAAQITNYLEYNPQEISNYSSNSVYAGTSSYSDHPGYSDAAHATDIPYNSNVANDIAARGEALSLQYQVYREGPMEINMDALNTDDDGYSLIYDNFDAIPEDRDAYGRSLQTSAGTAASPVVLYDDDNDGLPSNSERSREAVQYRGPYLSRPGEPSQPATTAGLAGPPAPMVMPASTGAEAPAPAYVTMDMINNQAPPPDVTFHPRHNLFVLDPVATRQSLENTPASPDDVLDPVATRKRLETAREWPNEATARFLSDRVVQVTDIFRKHEFWGGPTNMRKVQARVQEMNPSLFSDGYPWYWNIEDMENEYFRKQGTVREFGFEH